MIKRFGAMVTVLTAVALGVGCGSGGSDSSTVAAISFDPSVTHAQYRQQANAICNEAKTESILALQKRAKEDEKASLLQLSPEVQTEFMLASMQKALDRIHEVPAPAESEPQVERFFNTFRAVIDSIQKEEMHTTQEFAPALLRIDRAATAYGLDRCSYSR